MPVHWYYDRQALNRDYGWVTDFREPRPDHPDSILWRSNYKALNDRGEILHDQVRYWGRRNVHYHQFLAAGENTLNLKLARLLMDSVQVNSAYRTREAAREHLALKYHDNPEKMLIASTNLGGDNVGRGALLGALAGAEHGLEAFPAHWITGLLEKPPEILS